MYTVIDTYNVQYMYETFHGLPGIYMYDDSKNVIILGKLCSYNIFSLSNILLNVKEKIPNHRDWLVLEVHVLGSLHVRCIQRNLTIPATLQKSGWISEVAGSQGKFLM